MIRVATDWKDARECFARALEVILDILGGVPTAGVAGDAAPSAGLPVFSDFAGENPGWQLDEEEIRECVQIRFVHLAQLFELTVGSVIVAKLKAGLSETSVQARELFGRQAVGAVSARLGEENLREIGDGVAAHGESEPRLLRARIIGGGDQKRGGIENCRQSGEPGFVGVLRAEITDDGIGDVTFQQLGGPVLPIAEQDQQRVQPMRPGVAEKQFGSGGRRAGTGIEQDDGDFAFGEGLIDDRQIADDQREKSEAQAAFKDGEDALGGSVGSDVAKAQGEECGAAEIETGFKRWAGGVMRSVAVVQETESDNQTSGPEREQNQQGKRTEKAEE